MPERSSLSTRVLGTLEEIEAIAADWRALERHCADPLGYFQSYDWCSNWVRHFAGGDTRPYVITVWRDTQLVALWPRMIVTAAYLRRLETLGAPHTQYCGALIRQGAAAAAELADELKSATRAANCDVTISRAVPQGSALAELLAEKPLVPGGDNVASILDLSQYQSAEDYTQGLGKLQKRNRNRRRNHLARLGELQFEVIWPGHPEFEDLVRTGAEMKRRWLAETNRYSVGFSMAGYEDFLAGLDGNSEAMSGACLSVLRAGVRVVAVELGFIQHRHYYAYIGGFDWDLKDLSPGKVQMDMTVCWLIEQGVAGYDLLINPATYKDSWTNRTLAVESRAEALTWRGRFYTSAWLPTLRPAIKRLHSRLPQMASTMVSWLRPMACLLLYA